MTLENERPPEAVRDRPDGAHARDESRGLQFSPGSLFLWTAVLAVLMAAMRLFGDAPFMRYVGFLVCPFGCLGYFSWPAIGVVAYSQLSAPRAGLITLLCVLPSLAFFLSGLASLRTSPEAWGVIQWTC